MRSYQLPQTSVLVVDDDEMTRKATVKLLRANHYDVSEASSGEECIQSSCADRPDIILVDVVMPDVDGFETVSRLLKEIGHGESMVAMFSSYKHGEEYRTRGFEAGADDYILKPIGNREFLARIRALERVQQGRAGLREKVRLQESLMRQMHHRIKNNLTIIESLIDLKSADLADHASALLMEDLRRRIHSIEALHECLYRTGDVSEVDVRLYLEDLAANLSILFRTDKRDIPILVDVPSIRIGMDTALPVGMVVTELVTNAARFAFPDQRTGRVRISLAVAEKRAVLTVEDDGIGLPLEFDPAKSSTLGFKLVLALAEQLGSKLELLPVDGTAIRFDFPLRG